IHPDVSIITFPADSAMSRRGPTTTEHLLQTIRDANQTRCSMTMNTAAEHRFDYGHGLHESARQPLVAPLRDVAFEDERPAGRAAQLDARVVALTQELGSRSNLHIIGESQQWRAVLTKAARVAATETTVIVTGESGTGKEVVARFIHRASARAKGPFVALNCAALPEQLLESELFGYERGAFTSAQQSKPGLVEMAAGGVLFLDEVSEMSLASQAKFLRLLQEREFQRLGGTRVLKANIRVIAATNRDLAKAVERGTFREDLFYRLHVFDIPIAPLRERPDDILPLSAAFLQEIARTLGRPAPALSAAAREALLGYEWPGNIRGLRNALERAAIVCEGGFIQAEDLGLQKRAGTASQASTPSSGLLTALERTTIARVLQETGWNKSTAAKRLGLSRTQLYGRMRKFGIADAAMVKS